MTRERFTIHKMMETYNVAQDVTDDYIEELVNNGKLVEDISIMIHDNGLDMSMRECCDFLNKGAEAIEFKDKLIDILIMFNNNYLNEDERIFLKNLCDTLGIDLKEEEKNQRLKKDIQRILDYVWNNESRDTALTDTERESYNNLNRYVDGIHPILKHEEE